MEDLYGILQADPQCTSEQLKQKYRRLALKHHPDKNKVDSAFFIKLNNAYEILCDPDMRREYDVKWRERCTVQDLPIQEEVVFSDFHENDCEEGEDTVYTYPCRCGDAFLLTRREAKLKFDIVCCETCSLTIKVLYEDIDCDDLDVKSMKTAEESG